MSKRLYILVFIGALFSVCDHLHAMTPPGIADAQEEFFDEFDCLIDDAIDRGVLKEEIEFQRPTTAQIVLVKVGGPFLKAYTFIVLQYRALREWLAKQWQKSWFYVEECDECTEQEKE